MSEPLDFAAAKELLLFHSLQHADLSDPRSEKGFLGSLRPYRGLREENYHEVMRALEALAPYFKDAEVDRQVVCALWGMCFFARAWAVHPGGMVRRNRLVTDADVARLEGWLGAIGYAVALLHDANDVAMAFEPYRTGGSFP